MSWARIEVEAYWICFVATFLAIAVWESFKPKRELSVPAERRWRNHGVMLAIAAVSVTFLLRLSPVVVAEMASTSRFGILNKAWLPFALRCAISIALLDLLQYWIHWSFHHFAWLWRVHQVHHSDPDYDVSTAARFHPIEVVGTQVVRLSVIALLAPPTLAVFLAELLTVVLNLSAHANASLPGWVEKTLRLVFITPDVHRIHHSQNMAEQQRNLGQTFSWWDGLFGTRTRIPNGGDEAFKTGLAGLEKGDGLNLSFMLAEPFQPMQEDPDVGSDPLP